MGTLVSPFVELVHSLSWLQPNSQLVTALIKASKCKPDDSMTWKHEGFASAFIISCFTSEIVDIMDSTYRR